MTKALPFITLIAITYGLNLNSKYYHSGSLITGGGACGSTEPTNVATKLGEGTNGTNDFTGGVGEVIVYNSVISVDDIMNHYNRTKGRHQ